MTISKHLHFVNRGFGKYDYRYVLLALNDLRKNL